MVLIRPLWHLLLVIKYLCEIYTDVDGVYATDLRLLPKAKRLDIVSYEEMMEMSALGAGVLETRSVELAKTIISPLYLGKTLSNVKGTWIMSNEEILERKAVTGVALDKHMMHVTISYPYLTISYLPNYLRNLKKVL